MSNDTTASGDQRHGYMTDDVMIDVYARLIGPFAFDVYQALSRHYNGTRHDSFPSVELIAEELRISKRTVHRAIKTLREHGMVAVGKNGRHNVYRLLSPRYWRTSPSAQKAPSAPDGDPTAVTETMGDSGAPVPEGQSNHIPSDNRTAMGDSGAAVSDKATRDAPADDKDYDAWGEQEWADYEQKLDEMTKAGDMPASTIILSPEWKRGFFGLDGEKPSWGRFGRLPRIPRRI